MNLLHKTLPFEFGTYKSNKPEFFQRSNSLTLTWLHILNNAFILIISDHFFDHMADLFLFFIVFFSIKDSNGR